MPGGTAKGTPAGREVAHAWPCDPEVLAGSSPEPATQSVRWRKWVPSFIWRALWWPACGVTVDATYGRGPEGVRGSRLILPHWYRF